MGVPALNDQLKAVLRWYVHRHWVDRRLPFYCDPGRVGAFAIAPAQLAKGDEGAIFALLVTLSMYQALRDIVIMRRQHSLPPSAVRWVADEKLVGGWIQRKAPCSILATTETFERECDVWKRNGVVDCGIAP